MKRNLVLVGYGYAQLRRLATQFAEFFDMRFFDIYDYFNFDNQPNTIADIYHQNGWDYVDKEIRGAVKMVHEFENIVFVLDLKIASICTDMFDTIKENDLVIFIDDDERIKSIRKKYMVYKSQEEMAYFLLTDEALSEIKEKVVSELADIVIDKEHTTYEQIKEKIIQEFKNMM